MKVKDRQTFVGLRLTANYRAKVNAAATDHRIDVMILPETEKCGLPALLLPDLKIKLWREYWGLSPYPHFCHALVPSHDPKPLMPVRRKF